MPVGSKCGCKYLIVFMFLYCYKYVLYNMDVKSDMNFFVSSNRWTLTTYRSLSRADLRDFMMQKAKEE
jgi:hypothetical protein